MAETARYFFVDEAGDLTLLGRRGRIVVGEPGVSHCFMVGVAQIADPVQIGRELEELRREILDDPYLHGIPSLESGRGKTALCFHAKDDCDEVRERVFRLLHRHEIKVMVGVRRKSELADLARTTLERGARFDPDSVYDDLVKTLFKRMLHKADRNIITFARRGKRSRQAALEEAIQRSQRNFSRDTGIPSDKPTQVIPSVPSVSAGLQVVDYFLWALQRMYERGQDRYFSFLAEHYRLIMDFDDKRGGKDYGAWYNESNPLTKVKMLPVTG